MEATNMAWSPVANELAIKFCPDNQLAEKYLFLLTAPTFSLQNLSPPQSVCAQFQALSWQPNGQQILFDAVLSSDPQMPLPIYSRLFVTDRLGVNSQTSTLHSLYLMSIKGWMDNSTAVLADYGGGGSWIISLFNLETDEVVISERVYVYQLMNISEEHIATQSGEPCCIRSAVVISPQPPNPLHPDVEFESGQYATYLSIIFGENGYEVLFNSRFEDWLNDSQQMLVLTWPAELDLSTVDVLHEPAATALEVWDVPSGNLTKVIPRAIYGRVSPNRQHLLFLTPANPAPNLQLLNRVTGEILWTEPVWATADELSGVVFAHTSFAPNSQFATFYTTDSVLWVYDLATGVLTEVGTTVPSQPIWSPDSHRFVYVNESNRLAIFDTRTQTSFSLLREGEAMLGEPQWSYDGRYLSVTIFSRSEQPSLVAILRLPD